MDLVSHAGFEWWEEGGGGLRVHLYSIIRDEN